MRQLLKAVEIGDHVIAHTPGAKQPIYANRGADHPAYEKFSPADHIAAANVHANRAKELHIASARQGGSMTLKRQAAQSMHISTTHRQAGTAQPKRLASSMAARVCSVMKSSYAYADAIFKAEGGEGSRGGHIVGHTSSGKPIYSHSTLAHTTRNWKLVEHAYDINHHSKKYQHYGYDHDHGSPTIEYVGHGTMVPTKHMIREQLTEAKNHSKKFRGYFKNFSSRDHQRAAQFHSEKADRINPKTDRSELARRHTALADAHQNTAHLMRHEYYKLHTDPKLWHGKTS